MRIFLLPLLLSWFTAASQPQTIQTDSEIKEVTVFRQGAQVSREAQVQVPAGRHTILFDRLPQNMDPNSVQLQGSGNLTVLSIAHKRNYLTEDDKSQVILDLEKQLEKVEQDIARKKAAEDALQHEKRMILANQNIGKENYSLQQLQQTADFFRKRIQAINEELNAVAAEVQELEKEKRKIENQLNQERQAFSQKTSQVEVKVSADAATTAGFELMYMVRSASWSSSYDARVSDLESPVELTQKAVIHQQTGEDWEDVKLTLNTGNPVQGQQVPFLNTWYVDFVSNERPQMAPANYRQKAESMRNTNEIAMDEEVELIEKDISYQSFGVAENLTREEYSIERRQNIPSSGNPEIVQLREMELPAEYQHHIKPRLENAAYLIAKVYDWDQYNLMSGDLSLYNGHTFVGNSYLNVSTPDDTLQLSLGRDENIVVTRSRIRSKTEKTFLGRSRVEEFTWKIEVRNSKNTAVDVLLKEPIPVSRNSEIEVETEQLSGGNLDEKSGIVKWQFLLEPNQQREFTVSYNVKYPREKQVNF